jgi:hypothetical protein
MIFLAHFMMKQICGKNKKFFELTIFLKKDLKACGKTVYFRQFFIS